MTRGLQGFRTNYTGQVNPIAGLTLTAEQMQPGAEVLFLVPSNSAFTLQVMNTCVLETNNSTDDSHQCVAYYLSALSCLFPGLKPFSRDLLSQAGYHVTEVKDTELGQHALELQPWMDVSTAMVVFGQLVLVLYKNVDSRSYNTYFQNRANALKSVAGVLRELNPEGGDIIVSFDAACIINTVCGSSNRLKIALLHLLVTHRTSDSKLGSVCAYLCEIISWVGMSGIVFIFEMLCLPRRPKGSK